ncbi:hypothetical protein PUV54_07140 [Hyphococcus flavus]|uniref:Uncharacterized protein n=1 Tax=Hyphococcus flavus TaxID=1866326 RepID=A0AAE9ZE69_9PROT|nr:hypothetical protein [Hyphococcus flavus]WDI32971.1 hypothetical protein PUV54_07140 [Hyphococcus flavus]
MTKKDLRPEQIKLLRFEKILKETAEEKAAGKPLNKAPVLAGLAVVAAAGAGAAAKLGNEAPLQFAADIEAAAKAPIAGDAWLINLAEVVTKSHSVVESLAEQGAFALLQANGTPKSPPAEVVQSLLTNGLF